jgi:nucleoside-diphosphate-sugar epimerase
MMRNPHESPRIVDVYVFYRLPPQGCGHGLPGRDIIHPGPTASSTLPLLTSTSMKVFVTGATGFIGSAVVNELISNGHKVIGLVRSDEGVKFLSSLGAEALRGTLTDIDVLQKGASESDGVIHTAFIHDWSNFAASCATDKAAIEAIGAVLVGSNKPFVVTSGILGLASGRLATEDDEVNLATAITPRAQSDIAALALASQGVRVSILRLPPSVHGDEDHGFVPLIIKIARDKGVSGYIGEGTNRWCAVHRLDAARLYRLALEKGRAGANYHAVGDESVTTKSLAEAIGAQLKLDVVSKTSEEAPAHFGFFSWPLSLDGPCSSAKTQEEFGWTPTGPGLIEDLQKGTYFK